MCHVSLRSYQRTASTRQFIVMHVLIGVSPPQVDTSAVLRQIAEWTGDNDFMRWLQHQVETSPNCEKLIMAFVANEIIEYPRDALVLVATPAIARAIGRAPPKATKKAH